MKPPSIPTDKKKVSILDTEKDPLDVFDKKFNPKSSRTFNPAPSILREASKLVNDNYHLLSVCDEIDDLILLHYRDTIEDELKTKARNNVPIKIEDSFRLVKGCIFDKETGYMKVRSYPFVPHIKTNKEELLDVLNKNKVEFIREFHEGNVVKIWCHKKIVYVSTSRRISSLKSKKDGCPSIEEMLRCIGFDVNRLKFDKGEVYILLIVHPNNQIQNPNEVEPSLFHLDTWVYTDKKKKDTFFCMNSDQKIDIGIKKLPYLTIDEAISLLEKDKYIYVQTNQENGTVYRSFNLDKRCLIRGDREHLYHRFVELKDERILFLETVPFACKERVKEYPLQYNKDIENIAEYITSLLKEELPLPPEDTSLFCLYKSVKNSKEDVKDRLKRCRGVVIYNMISLLRTKIRKRNNIKNIPRTGNLE